MILSRDCGSSDGKGVRAGVDHEDRLEEEKREGEPPDPDVYNDIS